MATPIATILAPRSSSELQLELTSQGRPESGVGQGSGDRLAVVGGG